MVYFKMNVFRYFLLFFIFAIFPFQNVFGEENQNSGNSDFDFDAVIKSKDISDGTAPFDLNDETGYDSNIHNGIVRTFDSITYPLKITVNPKKTDSLKNIKLKITGQLQNGITNNRVNAVFSIGNTSDLPNRKVSFEQYYTIQQTGNSVMIPIVVETKGAINGTLIRPEINVQVVSIDSKVVPGNVSVSFKELPETKITGKVNLKTKISGMYGSDSIVERMINPTLSQEDMSLVQGRGMGLYISPLNQQQDGKAKSSLVGATFPTGKIKFHYELSGYVSWTKKGNETLNFSNKNKSIEIFSHHAILPVTSFNGAKNTISEKLNTYSWKYAHTLSMSRSQFTNYNSSTIETQKNYSVWNSGNWSLSKPKINNQKITVDGEISDYVIGSTFPTNRADGSNNSSFSLLEYAFSTQGFIFKTPNEYFPLYGLNKQNEENNVYYTAKAVIDSYEDENKKVIPVNTSWSTIIDERNVPLGAYSLQNAFFTTSGKELGTPNAGWSWMSKGDATLIRGQDVRFSSTTFASKVFTLGGLINMVKWNTDSFELTKEYAEKNYQQYKYNTYVGLDGVGKIDANKVQVKFGVAKSDGSSFRAVTNNELDDYNWFLTYEEAVKHGLVGSMMYDVNDELGNRVIRSVNTFLKVKTKNIGSLSDKQTPNIAAQQSWTFPTKDRKVSYKVRQNDYKDYTHYDSLGKLTKLQDPVGNTTNFETLGITNAELSGNLTSDQSAYYTTDKINWRAKTSVTIPSAVDFSNGQKVEVQEVLPKGLIYEIGSSKIGSEVTEPKIVDKEDGSSVLVYTYYLSNKIRTVPDVTFSTTIDPFVLANGNQATLVVKTIPKSPELDSRTNEFRQGSKSINIVKIGMVGISAQVPNPEGKKNSDYFLTIKPYTTIDDEIEVKGISVLPYDKDENGSSFNGSTWLKKIQVNSTKNMDLYITDQIITEKNPNKIDLKKNNWKKVSINSSEAELSKARTFYFVINDVLSKNDKVEIRLNLATKDNQFNDTYINKTSINSGSEYKLSPESNRIKYRITSDAEVSFQSMRIFTEAASKGLQGSLTIVKNILNDNSKPKNIDLVIYDKNNRKEVYRKKYTIENMSDNVTFTIPSTSLTKNTHKNYEAVFENYELDSINVLNNAKSINTDGYTSSETNLSSVKSAIDFKGVVMTERTIGKEMELSYETLHVNALESEKIKSGYGIDFSNKLKVKYNNELKKQAEFKTSLYVDGAIVENKGDYQKNANNYQIPLEIEKQSINDSNIDYEYSYNLPEVISEVGSGQIYLKEKKEKLMSEGINTIEAGKKLYVPIWIDQLGNYDFSFTSNKLGINLITFSIQSSINVYAFMYATIDSPTSDKDELLLEPVYPETKVPKGWLKSETAWLEK